MDTQVWTGGHLSNGSWTWTDGSSWQFTNWAKGEPSKKEDFIELVFIPPEMDWRWKSGQWNNLKGSRKIPYVCQYDFLQDVQIVGNKMIYSRMKYCFDHTNMRIYAMKQKQ